MTPERKGELRALVRRLHQEIASVAWHQIGPIGEMVRRRRERLERVLRRVLDRLGVRR